MNNDAWQASNRLQVRCFAVFSGWKPLFEEQFPGVKFDCWSANVGPFPMAEARRNIFFSAVRTACPDTLDLQFTFSNGASPPTVDALLLWGDDAGCIELMLTDDPISVDHPALQNIDHILEQFREKMIECLVRGLPTSLPSQVIISTP